MKQNCEILDTPLRTVSVLVFGLLLIHFCRGQLQLIAPPQQIVAVVGGDIILPCHLEPAVDVAAKTLEWTRSDLNSKFVFVWRDGQDFVTIKNPSYRGRTSLFTDELKHGNISLKLSILKPGDEGRYRCFIPAYNVESFIDLVVGSLSTPVISLSGTDTDKGGVVLQCESKSWYPEPEVLWLDSEGNLLSAGPTETVRGPDDLYTVSSRVTVEKRHSNNITCRVQQRNINQARETHIHVPDNLFIDQSPSAVVIGLSVTVAVCIMLILVSVFVVWKRKQTKKKNKTEEKKTNNDAENQCLMGGEGKVEVVVKEEEMKNVSEEGRDKKKEERMNLHHSDNKPVVKLSKKENGQKNFKETETECEEEKSEVEMVKTPQREEKQRGSEGLMKQNNINTQKQASEKQEDKKQLPEDKSKVQMETERFENLPQETKLTSERNENNSEAETVKNQKLVSANIHIFNKQRDESEMKPHVQSEKTQDVKQKH